MTVTNWSGLSFTTPIRKPLSPRSPEADLREASRYRDSIPEFRMDAKRAGELILGHDVGVGLLDAGDGLDFRDDHFR